MQILIYIILLLVPVTAAADKADVLNVDIINEGNNRFSFYVTVQHNDTGWDHYVDRWEILTTEGHILSLRVLHHPHVKEQPFTRNLPFVPVPGDIEQVVIRAHCTVDDFGGQEVLIKVPR